MAQYTKRRPDSGTQWVCVDVASGDYELWQLAPTLVGKARFVGDRRWQVSLGAHTVTVPTSMEAEHLLVARLAEQGGVRRLEAGTYRAEVESVSQSAGEIRIRLRSGEEVRIETSK